MDWPYLHLCVTEQSWSYFESDVHQGVFVILGNIYDPETRTWNPSALDLVRSQEFWFTMGMTVL